MGREKHQRVWKDALHRPTPAIPASTMRARNEPKVNGRRANCPNGSRFALGARARAPPAMSCRRNTQHPRGVPTLASRADAANNRESGKPLRAIKSVPSLWGRPTTFPRPSRDLPEAVAVSILRTRPYAPGGPSPGSGAKASGRHGCLGQSDPIGDAQRNGRIVEVVAGIVQPRADAVAQHDEGTGSIAEHV